jgi:hypothetical protein
MIVFSLIIPVLVAVIAAGPAFVHAQQNNLIETKIICNLDFRKKVLTQIERERISVTFEILERGQALIIAPQGSKLLGFSTVSKNSITFANTSTDLWAPMQI